MIMPWRDSGSIMTGADRSPAFAAVTTKEQYVRSPGSRIRIGHRAAPSTVEFSTAGMPHHHPRVASGP
jgi:hypothetical protein